MVDVADNAGLLALREALAKGQTSVVHVAERVLNCIDEHDESIQAFAWLDQAGLREQAVRLDQYRASGRPLGPLHGLPVTIKDIIDVAAWPTANGTELDSGRVAQHDAGLIRRLKNAGALLVGKARCTELAFMHPAPTRNPVDIQHSPGGSSSGSAAAVAAGMVPLAIGTQTGGSLMRPASYCGVFAYKPSFGAIGRSGVLAQSPSLDTVGCFADSADGLALLGDVLWGEDSADPHSRPGAPPQLQTLYHSKPPVTPTLGLLCGESMPEAEPDMQAALEELADMLGARLRRFELPQEFATARSDWETINLAEMAVCYQRYGDIARDAPEALSEVLRKALDKARGITAKDYLLARDRTLSYQRGLHALLNHADALLCPSSAGPAPKFSAGHTGSSEFNSLFTLTGQPTVSLPLLQNAQGLPMGVQLVGRHSEDGRLLRNARWLLEHLQSTSEA